MFKQTSSPFIGQFQETIKGKQYITFTAEVVDIILDETHSLYKSNHSIGMIVFKSYYGGMNGVATALNAYNTITPLIHESVLIVQGTDPMAGTTSEVMKYYYMDTVNAWNIINCNLVPFSTRDINRLKPIKSEEYSNFTGITPDIKDTVSYGKYFKEKLYIPKLKPFEGDIIYQGRWGQSIRFGSIVNKGLNGWSDKGELGTPIMILRVNQSQTDIVNDITIEDINKDSSSIYICDNVNIPLEVASQQALSYKYSNSSSNLIDPKNFIGRQLLFTSDRIILNAKKDGILISSKKTIHINSNESINLDSTKSTIIDAPEIVLGSNANSPATKGNETKKIFTDLINELSNVCKLLASINTIGSPAAQSLNPVLVGQFTKSASNFAIIANNLNTILSKKINIE